MACGYFTAVVQINQQVTPAHPDGWHFWEGGIRLESDTYKGLVLKVTEYRISARRDWQTAQEEINEYLAMISPGSVAPSLVTPQKTGPTLGDRVYNWMAGVYDKVTSAPAYASAAEAARRAAICTQCPWNQVSPNGCGLCVESMNRMRKAIAKNRTTSQSNWLYSCFPLGMDLRSAVHLEDDLLGGKSDDGRLPVVCWRKLPPVE